MISLTVSVTEVVRMLVSAHGWEDSLACLSALMVWKVLTFMLISITERSIPWLVSAMNCSHTAFRRLSTSFLESSKCSCKVTTLSLSVFCLVLTTYLDSRGGV